LLSLVGPVFPDGSIGGRFGLERAQVVFDHPILYGVFCASAFGLTWYAVGFGQPNIVRLTRVALVSLAAFFSLSAGAFAAVIAQASLIGWERATRDIRKRWRWLSLACICAYFAIDLISNRSPFHVIVTYLTFNVHSAYNRILVWEFGSAEVWRNPLFGIGFNDWIRPSFMSSSMDNFWLVIAVRYGLPAFVLFAAAIVLIFTSLGRARIADAEVKSCRLGVLVTLGGLIIAGTTVHFWNAIYCHFLFLLGSGMWILNQRETSYSIPVTERPPARHNTIGIRSGVMQNAKGSKSGPTVNVRRP
jgi:hypothetical protein